jgi:hypothetical protein
MIRMLRMILSCDFYAADFLSDENSFYCGFENCILYLKFISLSEFNKYIF